MNRIPHFLASLLILAAAPVLAQDGLSAPADTIVPIDGVVAVVGDQPILRPPV
jgi:hypothetical protein